MKEKDIQVKGIIFNSQILDEIRGIEYEDISIKTSDGIKLHGFDNEFIERLSQKE